MKSPKVKISTGRINIEVEMKSDKQADWNATRLASILFQDLEVGCLEESPKDDSYEIILKPEETVQEEQKVEQPEEVSEEKPAENIWGGVEKEGAFDKGNKIKGFVYIKCAHCGAISGRCLKKPQDLFVCPECGEETELKELRDLSVKCECGKTFVYHTNLKIKMFDINCLECGSPVAVFWNEKKEKYETMRR